MTTTHQAKRPYAGPHSQSQVQYQQHHQSTITSYFPTSCSPSPPAHAHPRTILNKSICTSPGCPALPSLVQSNLLSVGMRVRKSVPEGYKTGKASTANAFISSSSQKTAYNSGSIPAAAATARRELTPFCGILKVGGMAVQSWDNQDADEGVPGEDEVPFLSSQGSRASTSSSGSCRLGSKRRFDDDEVEGEREGEGEGEGEGGSEGLVYDIWRDADHDDGQLSPKSCPPLKQAAREAWRRAIAVPKSRLKGTNGGTRRGDGVKKAAMEGQENDSHLSIRAVEVVDFGEAEFMDWSSCLS